MDIAMHDQVCTEKDLICIIYPRSPWVDFLYYILLSYWRQDEELRHNTGHANNKTQHRDLTSIQVPTGII